MRYCIRFFSSSLLLDPEGKVLLVNQRKMRGQDLLKPLDELLPP